MIDYYLVFLAGVVPGYAVRHPRLGRVAYALMAVSGNTMVALYGMKIASVREFRQALPWELFSATLIALLAAVGSVLAALAFVRAVQGLSRVRGAEAACMPPPAASAPSSGRAWRVTGLSVALFGLGGIGGRLLPGLHVDAVLRILLLIMITAVGVQSGQALRAFRQHREHRPPGDRSARVIFFGLPVFIMAGTLLFSAGAGLLTDYRWSECMLCAAPMGWQTLGGPMVEDLRGPPLGNLAFLTNMIRDIVSLLMIPLISRGRQAWLGVTPGGVSTMDVLLPSVLTASGSQYLFHAVWIGGSCSLWAPFLIHLVARVLP